MKIIHTADLHLESCLEANLKPILARERKKELIYNVERLIDYANSHSVDRIIIAGDLFDSKRYTVKTKSFILDLITSNSNIDFIYITGNHDEYSFLKGIPNIPSNLKVFTDEFETISYSDCDITAINYLDKYDYSKLNLKDDKVNIVVMHGDITTNINLNELKDKNIDYLALGHYHKYMKGTIDDRGVYCYSGTLEGRGFDEIGEKGFVLLDIDSNKIRTEFVPFSNRILHEVTIDITDYDSYQEIRKNLVIKLNDIKDKDMVKVILTGSYKLGMIKQNEILEESLNDKYYFAKVKDETHLKINPKEFENDISLKGEFIRNVLNSDLSEDEKNQVIEYGIKALMEEEV